MHEGMSRRLPSKEELLEGIHKQVDQSTPSNSHLRPSLAQACSNSRRRKGVPHRAPSGPQLKLIKNNEFNLILTLWFDD